MNVPWAWSNNIVLPFFQLNQGSKNLGEWRWLLSLWTFSWLHYFLFISNLSIICQLCQVCNKTSKNTHLSFSLLSKLLTPYILKSDGLKGRFLFVAKSLYYTGWDPVRAMVERNIEKCSTCFIITDNNFIQQTKVFLI